MDLIPFLDLCDTANSFLNEKFTLSQAEVPAHKETTTKFILQTYLQKKNHSQSYVDLWIL